MPQDRPDHHRQQPPLVHRLDRDPGRGSPPRALPREVELLRGHRLQGPAVANLLASHRRGPRPSRGGTGGAGRTRRAAAVCWTPERPSRCTPEGTRSTRRPPVQGPHRRRLPRPADRRPGRPGRPDRHRQGHAGRQRDAHSSSTRVTIRFGEPLDLSHHGPATSGGPSRRDRRDHGGDPRAHGQELAGVYNEAPRAGRRSRRSSRRFRTSGAEPPLQRAVVVCPATRIVASWCTGNYTEFAMKHQALACACASAAAAPWTPRPPSRRGAARPR